MMKCNKSGRDALKGVHSAICGMKYIDLGNKEIIYFSYNNIVKEKCNLIKILNLIKNRHCFRKFGISFVYEIGLCSEHEKNPYKTQ